jgi:hypothetical protein
MSEDGVRWYVLPPGLGEVTGKLPGSALVLNNLTTIDDHEIDLWDYVEYPFSMPVIFGRGLSTVCAVAAPYGQAKGMTSHKRKVVAVGQLTSTFAVYLKAHP